MSKSIIIIGGGIAGLSAGCYGQMNGYRTQIFELHDKPGGLCTSWKRKGYTFDGCIHWLVGSGDGTSFNRIWKELGALQGKQIVNHKEFTRVEGTNGKAFIVYTNIDRLEQHMKELAPADTKVIKEFCQGARRFTRFGQVMGNPSAKPGLLDGIKMMSKMLPFLPSLMKYGKISVQDFGARFSDPFLRQAFATVFEMPDFPVMFLMMTLAWMHNRDAGYPIGGSLEFAQGIEQRYLDLGGKMHYKARVEKILVEIDPVDWVDRAVGVRLTDGTEYRADTVISAADGHATIFDMLEGKYINDKIRDYYDDLPIFQPMIQVSMGVARDLSDKPHSVSFMLSEPLDIAGEARKSIEFKHYCYDPTLTPQGKSAVAVLFPSNYAYWKDLHQEPERYDAEKKEIAIQVIDQLDQRFPGFAGQIETVDVATPMTFERYTGNWQGSMEGWLPTTKTVGMVMGKGMDKTLPDLESFYMVGQWVEPGGGLPPAAQSGRGAIQKICKRDRKSFVALVP
ncbi:MAG: NAD(P)/FAD-dependent oxidoreductase [Chloroflexi bacterium]|nr:NAD(P)/FAD-dependent oxidoreductase [Chloroflexota bacterium]